MTTWLADAACLPSLPKLAINRSLDYLLKKKGTAATIPAEPPCDVAEPSEDNFYVIWQSTMENRFNRAAVSVLTGFVVRNYCDLFPTRELAYGMCLQRMRAFAQMQTKKQSPAKQEATRKRQTKYGRKRRVSSTPRPFAKWEANRSYSVIIGLLKRLSCFRNFSRTSASSEN